MRDTCKDLSGQPGIAAPHAQTRRLLESAIDGLPIALRTVFVLRAVENQSVEETAQCLRIPPPTVRIRYLRARAARRGFATRSLTLRHCGRRLP